LLLKERYWNSRYTIYRTGNLGRLKTNNPSRFWGKRGVASKIIPQQSTRRKRKVGGVFVGGNQKIPSLPK